MTRLTHPFVVVALFLTLPTISSSAFAQAPAGGGAKQGERLDVESIKQKYWAKGNETQMNVVQNRMYTREGKVELSVFGGTFSDDPFLSTRSLGASLGYHFSEYIGIRALYMKLFPKKSSAADAFLAYQKSEATTNPPNYFYGVEGTASLLYGKLSLLGKAIIYYDLHLSAGLGQLNTSNGTYLAPIVGIGQQIYLSQMFLLRFDYRLLNHSENLAGLTNKRTLWTDSLSLGLSLLF